MIFTIDHIVFAASPTQGRELRDRLAAVGFHPEVFMLEFPEIGAKSESLSYAGGGFVEFVTEADPVLSPRVWFSEGPRVIGLGFGSDDFENDTQWPSESGSWVMDEDHILPDGSRLNIHAAGPHHHRSDFYVFVMDRPDGQLQFPEGPERPRLRHLDFVGAEADVWRERLGRWLGLRSTQGGLSIADTELRFLPGDQPSVRVSPTFEVTSAAADIGLAGSVFRLLASS